MESYVATFILPELLAMGKVGVFVDMPEFDGNLSEYAAKDIRPYIYTYPVEQIKNYAYDERGKLKALELERCDYSYDPIGLPTGKETFNQKIFKANGKVTVEEQILVEGKPVKVLKELEIEEIPFIFLQLPCSLLTDVADYQIALTNFLSSDIYYGIKANFPFYVEEADNMNLARYTRVDDNAAFDNTDSPTEITAGAMKGRVYAKDTKQPNFIHPSSEPLRANMEKEEQMKREIRNLLHLAIQSLAPVRESADSKTKDETGLEAGLSRIGLELERFENRFSEIWSHYMSEKKPAEVKYPKRYQLTTDSDKVERAEKIKKLKTAVPSITYQKELSKSIASTLLASKISEETLKKIFSEIEKAEIAEVDPDVIHQDIEDGLLSHATAAKAKGYPDGEVEKAAEEHAERLKRIQDAQTPPNMGARGVPDSDPDPEASAKGEKRENLDEKETPARGVRGEGK
jgi:hypothetical protein